MFGAVMPLCLGWDYHPEEHRNLPPTGLPSSAQSVAPSTVGISGGGRWCADADASWLRLLLQDLLVQRNPCLLHRHSHAQSSWGDWDMFLRLRNAQVLLCLWFFNSAIPFGLGHQVQETIELSSCAPGTSSCWFWWQQCAHLCPAALWWSARDTSFSRVLLLPLSLAPLLTVIFVCLHSSSSSSLSGSSSCFSCSILLLVPFHLHFALRPPQFCHQFWDQGWA